MGSVSDINKPDHDTSKPREWKGEVTDNIGDWFNKSGKGAKGYADREYANIARQANLYSMQAQDMLREAGQQAAGYYQPYYDQGQQAAGIMGAAYGLQGPEAQAQFYQQYEQSPYAKWLADKALAGANIIDQNAAATRSLMGGNRLQQLEQYRQQQAREGMQNYMQGVAGLYGAGQQAAGNLADTTYGTASDVANLQVGQGENIAGSKLAGIQGFFGAGQATRNMGMNMMDSIMSGMSMGGMGG